MRFVRCVCRRVAIIECAVDVVACGVAVCVAVDGLLLVLMCLHLRVCVVFVAFVL